MGSRANLIGAGVFLSFVSLGSCSVTVVPSPGAEFWRTVVTSGSAALALAVFIAAGVTKPRH